MQISAIPVITIDGPSASGKGTVAQLVATELGFHYLDSGALYRLVALKAMQNHTNFADARKLADIATNLDVVFIASEINLEGSDVSNAIRAEQCGIKASEIASYQEVRAALTERQRSFRQYPGLVTDGRDMGSVIFPNANLKIFLTARATIRAQRRHNQLMEKGISANIESLLQDIQLRDERDSNRSVAPLRQNADTRLLDTSNLSILEAVNEVLKWYSTD